VLASQKTGSNYQIVKEQSQLLTGFLRAIPNWDSSFYRRAGPRQAVQKEILERLPEPAFGHRSDYSIRAFNPGGSLLQTIFWPF
jgi:hypothetical protein